MGTFLKDIRYAFRVLLKDRALTVVAILTLSLGIAAPVTWYSVLDKVVFKPLPFETLDQLVALNERNAQTGRQMESMAAADFIDLRNESRVYDSLAAYEPRELFLTGVTEPLRTDGAFVTSNFFQALGVTAAMGRTFLPEEEQAGRDSVLILSDRLWRQNFGADPNIIGRGIFVNDRERVVVGVMQPDFNYPMTARAWVPLTLTDKDAANRTERYLIVVGRLKPTTSTADAQTEADVLMRRIEERNPETNQSRRSRIVPLRVQVRGEFSWWFSAMCFTISLFVLALCCVNIITIQLARAWARQKELTLRAAVGASRWKIVRQLLTESILLSLLGGIPAILISYVSVEVIRDRVPPDFARFIPGWYSVSVDGRVLAFALLTTVVAGVVFGLLPALRASKIDLTQVLKDHSASGSKRHRVLKALIVIEVAVAIAVLAGAGSLLEGFLRLPNKYRGLNPGGVMTMQVSAMHWTADPNRAVDSLQRLLEGIRGLPGVQQAASASNVPGSIEGSASRFVIKSGGESAPGAVARSQLQIVSPEFFQTFSIPVLGGRGFGKEDGPGARRVVVISQKLAQQYFRGRDPINQEIKLGTAASTEPWLTIVGVVADISGFWFEQEPRPMLYLPYTQNPRRTTFLTVRADGDPMSQISAVTNEVRKIDKNIAISFVKPLDEVITEQLSGVRVAADFSVGLVFTSLLLALAGVYGMASFTVTQRTQEIGVRMALGARRRDVLMMTIRHALKLALIGVAVGLPLSLALSISMASFLWGVGSFNVATLTGQILLLVIVGILGSYLPAKRASAIEPVQALRHE